jgi:hypothetical protein
LGSSFRQKPESRSIYHHFFKIITAHDSFCRHILPPSDNLPQMSGFRVQFSMSLIETMLRVGSGMLEKGRALKKRM